MTIEIAGVDRTDLVDWQSFETERNATKEPGFMAFGIRRLHAGQTYEPSINDEIIATHDGERIFGGKVIRVEKGTVSGVSARISVQCKDWTIEADRKLVQTVFEDETVGDIARTLIHTYASDGIKALSCNAGADYCLVPNSASLNITGSQITIAFWWKSGVSTYAFVFGKVDYSAYGVYQDDTALVFFLNTSVDYAEISANTADFSDDLWHRVVFTYDGANMRCYVDSVEANDPEPLTGTILSDTTALGIGGDGFDCMVGALDEVVLETATWNQAAVDADYDEGRGRYHAATANTKGLWRFDDTANDDSGNGNNGTLQGSATYAWGKVSSNIRIDGVADDLTTVVDKITFNYAQLSQCLQELADLYDCDWDIDYYKNLVFRYRGTLAAPFNLSEDKQSFVGSSLRVVEDISQIRNSIYVRGGTELYSTTSSDPEQYVSDGRQRVFPLGQKYVNDALFTVERASSPYSSWTALTVGNLGTDDAGSFDCLYDANNRSLVFTEAGKPSSTQAIRVYGNYYLPVLINKIDVTSTDTYGTFEHRIVDNSISSRAEAKQRATAELRRYSQTVISGSFETYQDGLAPMQAIRITAPTIGVSGDYIIQRIVMRPVDPEGTKFLYQCDVVGQEVVDSIDVLVRLLMSDANKNIKVDSNEILDTYYGFREALTIGDATFTGTALPTGTPSFTEALTADIFEESEPFGENVGPTWVAGPYFPSVPYYYHFSKGGAGSAGVTAELHDSGGYNNGPYLLGKLTIANSYFEIRNKATGYFGAYGFRVEPGKTYRITCRMKSENVSGSGGGQTVNVLCSKADGTTASQQAAITGSGIAINKVWTAYSYDLVAGANSYWAHLELRCYGHTAAATLLGDFYFAELAAYELDGGGNPIGANLVANGMMERIPPFTAATGTTNRWIDGTSAGSSSQYDRKRVPLIDAGLTCQ